MALAVVTRTSIHRRHRARFIWGSLRVAWQARRSPGYLGGSLRLDGGATFWTLTVWTDGRAMNAFRGSGTHGRLMPKLVRWASEASTTAWQVDEVPSWGDAVEQMDANARWLEVAHPGEPHRSGGPRHRPSAGLAFPVPPCRTSRAWAAELGS